MGPSYDRAWVSVAVGPLLTQSMMPSIFIIIFSMRGPCLLRGAPLLTQSMMLSIVILFFYEGPLLDTRGPRLLRGAHACYEGPSLVTRGPRL